MAIFANLDDGEGDANLTFPLVSFAHVERALGARSAILPLPPSLQFKYTYIKAQVQGSSKNVIAPYHSCERRYIIHVRWN